MRTAKRGQLCGHSLTEMLVVVAVIIILMGMMSSGWMWVKSQAEVTNLVGRINRFGTALQLYYQASSPESVGGSRLR
jgi:type II secretory pathway pseudopilin PulG